MEASYRPIGKTRNPLVTYALFIVTLSLYDIYWWYQLNRELRDYLRDDSIRPGIALLAMFVPIANLVTLWRGGTRIRRAQELAGLEPTCRSWIGLVLAGFAALNIPYHQAQLNRVWAASD